MPQFNWEIVRYNIVEAHEELERIEHLILQNELTEEGFRSSLEHAFHHLNFAWNIRRVTTERYSEMADEDFNSWSKFPSELEAFKV